MERLNRDTIVTSIKVIYQAHKQGVSNEKIMQVTGFSEKCVEQYIRAGQAIANYIKKNKMQEETIDELNLIVKQQATEIQRLSYKLGTMQNQGRSIWFRYKKRG